MNGPAVVLLDPGCFTPFYDTALAAHLVARGRAVDWVTSRWEFEDLPAPSGVPVHHLFFPALANGRLARLSDRGGRLVRRALKLACYPGDLRRTGTFLLRRPPGILHVQWAHVPWLDVGLWESCRTAGWRVVYTVHDPHPLRGTTPRLVGRASRRLLDVPDAICVHGPEARRQVVGAGAPRERVYVVRPASAVRPAPGTSRSGARARLGLGPAHPIVLFFGFVKPYKGLDVLLASLARLREEFPKVCLVVAGEVMGSRIPYDRMVARLGLRRHVRWTEGYVPSDRVGDYFEAADVVVLPYLDGSASAVLLAAQACGRPTVATRVGEAAEIVRDGVTGSLVSPGDPAALRAALSRMLSDPKGAARMGARARAEAESRFTWECTAAQMDAVYRRVWEGGEP